MFTSIIKELLGTKIAECNEIRKYSQTLIIIDDEYESSNIYSERISGNIHLNHIYLAATK